MKKIIAILAATATIGFAGVAQAGFMESAFGNTVVVANGNGVVNVTLLFNEDGSFDFVQPDGQAASGTWTFADSSICMTLGGEEECHEIQDIAVGGSWSDANDDGSTTVISIVAGR